MQTTQTAKPFSTSKHAMPLPPMAGRSPVHRPQPNGLQMSPS